MRPAIDALIMAAGRGSRLGPETDAKPKSLVDLGGITPLEFQLRVLADRGIERAVIVTGYRHDLVEEVARKRASDRFQVRCIWNPFWSLTNVLGSAWMAKAELGRELIYLHADTIFAPSILDDLLRDRHEEAALPIDFRPCEPEQMKARLNGDGLVDYLSKGLGEDQTAGEFIGIGFFKSSAVRSIVEGMQAVLETGETAAYFEEAINWAIGNRGLRAAAVPTGSRPWTEIDFPEDLILARSLLPRLAQ